MRGEGGARVKNIPSQIGSLSRNGVDPTEAVMIRGKGKGGWVVSIITVPDHYSFS